MDELVRRLVARYDDDLVSIVLFGSVARGEAGPTSDIDMILVFRSPPRSRIDRFRLFWDALGPIEEERVRLAAQRIAFDWSPIILSVEEAKHRSRLYLDLVDDAVLLFDRDGFFAAVLADMSARLEEIGARKVVLPDGSAMWDLNPQRRPPWEVVL